MTLLKPKALRAGATLAIVSPAGAPQPEKVYAGMKALEELGYATRLMPHALDRGPLYFAGTVAARVGDLHAAFADAGVDGIVCTRGGWGSAELLPHLDVELIRAHAKALIGYSDITSLHLWMLERAGIVSFQGPMVAADFSHADGPHLASWRAALEGAASWEPGTGDGLRVLRAGRAEGMLTGGCLSIYVESLGTPYAARAHGGVLFLEDIGTKPYQWDRMLLHLRLASLLEGVRGIVFGDMAQCGEPERVEASLLHALADFAGPVAIGLGSGHVDAGNITLPFGVRVELDCMDAGNPRMHFCEAAVRP